MQDRTVNTTPPHNGPVTNDKASSSPAAQSQNSATLPARDQMAQSQQQQQPPRSSSSHKLHSVSNFLRLGSIGRRSDKHDKQQQQQQQQQQLAPQQPQPVVPLQQASAAVASADFRLQSSVEGGQTASAQTSDSQMTDVAAPLVTSSSSSAVHDLPRSTSGMSLVERIRSGSSLSTASHATSAATMSAGTESGCRRVGDDWVFVSTLGTGTFGRVFLVQHRSDATPTGAFYAMKTLQKSEVVRLRQVEHMNNEREILRTVRHPFIVSLRTSFQSGQNLFMCLDYVIGGELFSHLRRAVKFQNDVTRFYAAEILLALEHLHAHDIIYRDLKPENILLDGDGHIKVTDFGFAKRIKDRTWTLCGTPEYLAPEIIQSRGHGKAVDWWALGILIYEMLCGYPPFYDSSHIGIYEKILAGKIRWPGHLEAQAIDVIARLLTPDITKRLGNLSGGSVDVKQHPWFKYCRWDLLISRSIRPPIVPSCRSPGDTRNFDHYPELRRDQMQQLLHEVQGDDGPDCQFRQEFAQWA